MLDFIKNKTIFANKYHTHSEAVIISCYFNPHNSPYRLKAFKIFYESIKHLNHSIVECVIGDSKPQLEENKNIKRIYTKNLLWHKETLLNNIVKTIPKKYKYVFWLDADVIFTNLNWMVDSVKEFKLGHNILQPFEHCVHLNKDEVQPSFDLDAFINMSKWHKFTPNRYNKKVWRSFCANYGTSALWLDEDYNSHGHVGFAWGAKREILERVPLYDKALIGGADHIIAHAAAGQIAHKCITKAFTDNIDEVNLWSIRFHKFVNGKIGHVKGNLFHIWHGDIEKRQYLKRVQDFTSKTKEIVERDSNGLYITKKSDDVYMKKYFREREVFEDDNFATSMAIGYILDDGLVGGLIGGNMVGGIIGDALNTNEDSPISHTNPIANDFGRELNTNTDENETFS